MLRILKAARDRKLEIHPLAIRALIRNAHHAAASAATEEANALFLDLLAGRDAGTTRDGCWLMNETGSSPASSPTGPASSG